MSARYRRPCPTAVKVGYGDEAAADLALAHIRATDDPWRQKLPVRSYRCACGKWHLTSMELA